MLKHWVGWRKLRAGLRQFVMRVRLWYVCWTYGVITALVCMLSSTGGCSKSVQSI